MRVRTLVLTVVTALSLGPLLASPALADDGSETPPPPCQTVTCPDSGNWPK
ncbi:hypothetical protein [Nocardiopsis algeriensis]|uniref:Uncharacterized protein n=1 Tax=Nocardiopsis algeriensis TaxID=1478215 RepID=A0A841IK42_9ACTN|nr:hypothetical protein [Nocardiopsis algeriensis]MBB6118432.1 hypothetical protein [Nocardiopsis algeriensis]